MCLPNLIRNSWRSGSIFKSTSDIVEPIHELYDHCHSHNKDACVVSWVLRWVGVAVYDVSISEAYRRGGVARTIGSPAYYESKVSMDLGGITE